MDDGTSQSASIARTNSQTGAYQRLERVPGESYRIRRDLGGAPPEQFQSLVCFVQLSDLHVTDSQSPARVEFLDRYGDVDCELAPVLGRVGLYRPQEALTAQVVEAMVRAISRVSRGPLTGTPATFALSTGDATDNCQSNELETYIGLLDGGQIVTTDSGKRGRYDGVGSDEYFDPRYWHPDGSPDGEPVDVPRAVHDFPLVAGLLEAAITPFLASGLPLPWYAVHGNHDALFGGTLCPDGELSKIATGTEKRIGLREEHDPLSLLANNEVEPSPGLWGLISAPTRQVPADPSRSPFRQADWISRHLRDSGTPTGHGLALAEPGCCYYAFDVGVIRFLVLDTVNQAGGWQGSLDDGQFHWLEDELVAGSRHFSDAMGLRHSHDVIDRLFVLVSHHPLKTLINGFAPDGSVRHLEGEVKALLERFPNVVCWVNGHTHCNQIQAVRPTQQGLPSGLWQITTSSLIDWPQQSRLIEIAMDTSSGDVVIATTMLDHLGLIDPRRGDLDEVRTLAGWSRELAANAWQGRIDGEPTGRGGLLDRNAILVVPAPFEMHK